MPRRGGTIRRLTDGARDFARHIDVRAIGNDVERSTDFTNCPRPVLLLPGFMSTRRGLTVMERRLRRDGYGVFSLNLGGLLNTFNTRSIETSALLVREKIEALYARHEALGPLTIIGHSKGGLIGRYYVKRLGGHERANALITLGTPHHGTPNAYIGAAVFGLVARSIWQLMPMSPFIRRLQQGPFPAHVRFSAIYSREDNMVPYPAGTIEQGARANQFNVEVEGISHHEFLTRKAVYAAIRRELDLVAADWGTGGIELSEVELSEVESPNVDLNAEKERMTRSATQTSVRPSLRVIHRAS